MKLLVLFLLGVITSAAPQTNIPLHQQYVTHTDHFKYVDPKILKEIRWPKSNSNNYGFFLPNGTTIELQHLGDGNGHQQQRNNFLSWLTERAAVFPKNCIKLRIGHIRIGPSCLACYATGVWFVVTGYMGKPRWSEAPWKQRAVTLGASYQSRHRKGDITQQDKDAGDKVFLVNQRDTTQA
ncbi:hypothetical protein O3P69_013987 [Scylla paramamosain]|uniref:Uncharacterized protein n=1 Tax=Scylla paramamosain TaxID=85552 RepID=A0AAW0SQP8_SCYPA